jgi:broad specificity phosphatase PhoE
MKIALIRHAQTSANIDRVWHGHTDTQLTELGHEQAQSLGQHFHQIMQPMAIYSSPLVRARHTANAIAENFNLDIKEDDDLIEFGVGEYEGETFDRLNGELDFFPRMLADAHHCAPSGESRHIVTERMINKIQTIAKSHRGEDIAIVSHGMAISFVLMHWFGNDNTEWHEYITDNTSVTEITLDPHELVRFNHSPHLTGDLRNRSNLLSEREKK